jgi:hypothetical protein
VQPARYEIRGAQLVEAVQDTVAELPGALHQEVERRGGELRGVVAEIRGDMVRAAEG